MALQPGGVRRGLGLRLGLAAQGLVLLLHVLNLHGEQLAVFETGLQGVAGIFGVHMHLDDLFVVRHQHAVANGFQVEPQLHGLLGSVRVPADDELGAVGKVNLAVELSGGAFEELGGLLGPLLLREAGLNDNAAPEDAEHALQNQAEALSARIHHPGPLEHRQQLGSLLQGLRGPHAHRVPHPHGLGGPVVQSVPALLGGHPGHGENGALGGPGYGLIGLLHAQVQSLEKGWSVRPLQVPQALGHAPEQQGEDDPGVAPGPPQHGGGGLFGHLSGGDGLGQGLQGVGRGPDGHGHVGAGVAIRDGENIQVVNLLAVFGDVVGSGNDRVFQLRACNHGETHPS